MKEHTFNKIEKIDDKDTKLTCCICGIIIYRRTWDLQNSFLSKRLLDTNFGDERDDCDLNFISGVQNL